MKRTLIERIETTFKSVEREERFRELAEEGYRIVSSGPYTNSNMFPSVDVSRIKVIAERAAESVLRNGAELEACLSGFAELYGDPDAKNAIREWRNIERLYVAAQATGTRG